MQANIVKSVRRLIKIHTITDENVNILPYIVSDIIASIPPFKITGTAIRVSAARTEEK